MSEGAQKAEAREYRFDDDGRIPNNPKLPLLYYPGRSGAGALPVPVQGDPRRERLGGRMGERGLPLPPLPLDLPRGPVRARREREHRLRRPEGEVVEVRAGDVVVIPAGVGHKNEGSSGDFSVLGAYPRGQESYDLRTGEEGERPEVLENIRSVPLPDADPLHGSQGPLVERWSRQTT
ncbi:hypothetical protein [Rubrobacter marinus]|uniref:hypothetical protein n=1 Tax=Rubrobacter marinus TaxID=2653852 RepID=UPI001A9E5931|nr:hypothetical protein [Rubrobacter marinus]